MSFSNSRLKILTRIAQQTGTPAVSEPSSTTTAPATTTVQPPPAFNIASGPWAWITSSYNSASVGYLNVVLNIINTAWHYASNGQHNLSKDQNNIASLDPSGESSVDSKNLMIIVQLFYRTFLNSGQKFPQNPSGAQISSWADSIINSQALLNLSQLNPTGPAAQQMQLDGSLRQNIINNLNYLKRYNPVQQQRQ